MPPRLLLLMAAILRLNSSFASASSSAARKLVSFSSPVVVDRGRTGGRRTGSGSHRAMHAAAGAFEVAQIPCLDDNYGYLLHDPATGQTAAVDTPCAAAYQRELATRGWTLTHILNTHHHGDHVGGNRALKTAGVTVYGPAADGEIPGMDVPLEEGDTVPFGGSEAIVMAVGGHTLGHIAFYFPREHAAFVGDSLFALGCGRMFEGTPRQFWASLRRLRALPDATLIYCAHEYTESNARFALTVEPGNPALVARAGRIAAARARGEPTVPSRLGEEKATNPFLRGDVSAEIRRNVGAGEDEEGAAVFHKLRVGKDRFRG